MSSSEHCHTSGAGYCDHVSIAGINTRSFSGREWFHVAKTREASIKNFSILAEHFHSRKKDTLKQSSQVVVLLLLDTEDSFPERSGTTHSHVEQRLWSPIESREQLPHFSCLGFYYLFMFGLRWWWRRRRWRFYCPIGPCFSQHVNLCLSSIQSSAKNVAIVSEFSHLLS